MNRKSQTSSIDVISLMGFTDELQKIAAAVFKPVPLTGTTDVRKMMRKHKNSLTSQPKPISKPSEPTPSTNPDPISTNRTNQPPPVTAGGM